VKQFLRNKKALTAILSLAVATFVFAFACVGYAYAWFNERKQDDFSLTLPSVDGLISGVSYWQIVSVDDTTRTYGLKDGSVAMNSPNNVANTGVIVKIDFPDASAKNISITTDTQTHLLNETAATQNRLSSLVGFSLYLGDDVTMSNGGDSESNGTQITLTTDLFGKTKTLFDDNYDMLPSIDLGDIEKESCYISINYDGTVVKEFLNKYVGDKQAGYTFTCDFKITVKEATASA